MKSRFLTPLILIASLALAEPHARAEYPPVRPPRTTPPPVEGNYTIHPDQPRQIIKGLGFEIQLDSIASGNKGLPDTISAVPHDLAPEERARFYKEMIHGFRFCRLAAGLYWRGLDADNKQFQPRWPTQLDELHEMIQATGVEGVSMEYWSPAPYWKANNKLVWGAPLRCFSKNFTADPVYHGDTNAFLNDFAHACVKDLQTLRDSGIPISMWGLQNEPFASTPYSSCTYSAENYSKTFLTVAPMIRAFDPKIWIIADTAGLQYIAPALRDPKANSLIDAFVVHHVGSSCMEVKGPRTPEGFQQPSFQNEYEYLNGPATPDRCLNTVQHIMNWFQLGKAPTWFWIHALKPVGNKEASGYALGFWNPPGNPVTGEDTSAPGLEPGHWTWNKYNWNALAGFLRHMPWDSQALDVTEQKKDNDARIFVFRRPDKKMVIVLSNRTGADYKFNIGTGLQSATFQGWRYTPEEAGPGFNGVKLDTLTGPSIAPNLPDRTWEFWIQQ